MINDKDGHIPSPLIMFTGTVLRHALLEWQKNKGVPLKDSKSKLKADRPDCSNFSNYKNNGGKNSVCSAATGRNLLLSPCVADTYPFLMNTWTTLPESYQQRVYIYSCVKVKCQIHQVENRMATVIFSKEAACVDNGILPEDLTSTVAVAESEIGSTDPNILIGNSCKGCKLYFGIQGGRGEYEPEGAKSDIHDAIPTVSR
jgi:hypothetical protein